MLEAMLQRRFRETMRSRAFLVRAAAESAAAEAVACSLKARLMRVWLAEPGQFAAEVHRIAFDSVPDDAWLGRARESLAAGLPRICLLRAAVAQAASNGREVALSEGTLLELERHEARLPFDHADWYMRLPDASDFILRAYRRLLGRDGGREERAKWDMRVRIPFIGRRWLLRKLGRSGERRALQGAACES